MQLLRFRRALLELWIKQATVDIINIVLLNLCRMKVLANFLNRFVAAIQISIS